MKKIIFIIIALLLIFPTASALNLQIEKKSSNEVLIYDLKKPAAFKIEITNFGPEDNIEFYNLLGFEMFPIGTVHLSSGETKEIELKLSPIGEIQQRGNYILEYFIRGQGGSQIKQTLAFKIIDVKDAFEIGSGTVDPESHSLSVYIHNKVNFNFGDMKAKFTSPFFSIEREFTLGPNEKKEFIIELNKEDFKKLTAGFYTLNAEISVSDKKENLEGTINFVEKNIITETTKNYGLVISTKIIKKSNEGNAVAEARAVVKKNIISRLFTTFNPEPDAVERQGGVVYYIWDRSINPGEALEIKVKTNWLFPFLIIFFIILIVILTKQYSKTNIILRKKVNFVRAKGGEFALKITISVHAKKYVERVNIIDKLPPLVKLYEKFGTEKPFRIDEKNRRIEWHYDKLEVGEVRVLSYVIYSKVGVLGRFSLPSATALYERNGEIEEVQSNRAFFVAEQKGEVEEY
ncbi:MAG: hypothetical protein ABH804_01445 [archaeon]